MEKKVLVVGLVCVDIVAETEGFPIEDTDQRIPELCYRRGGNASNSSSVLAQLGMQSEFLGTLSNSMELEFIKKDFANHSVSIEHCPVLPDCEFPTSIVMINADSGSRTILHHSKNLPELSFHHFTTIDLNNYSWIHFEGRSGNVGNIKQMIEFLRSRATSVQISVEIEKPRPILSELLPLGDVVFVSKDFAQFSGFRSMNDAVKGFVGSIRPGAIVVCPWGSEGAAAGQKDVISSQSAYKPETIVDTLGAGDTFNAAFIYSQVNRWDWRKGLEFACLVAGSKVGQKGFQELGRFKRTLPGLFEYPNDESQR